MSFKKTAAIVAAAGALAAVSVPAMAFENQFNGLYKFKTIFSNWDNGGTAANSTLSPTALKDNNKANSYLEQRARVMYTAKASDDLKLVTHFELDARFGGTNTGKYGPAYSGQPGSTTVVGSPVAGSTDGGALDADGISLETKWVYLDFNVAPTNVKVGIQPYKDAFKGIFLDADLAAVYTTTKFGATSLGLGFARVYDGKGLANVGTAPGTGSGAFVGDKNTDIYFLDGKYAVSKDLSVGLSYYFAASNLPTATVYNNAAPFAVATGSRNQQSLLHTLGLNADAKVGAAKISGFAALQAGSQKTDATATGTAPAAATNTALSGYAFNVAAAVPVGPGTFRTAALYTSGDDGRPGNINTSWQPIKTYQPSTGTSTGASASSVSTYNEGGMMLLVRNAAQNNSNTDRFVVGALDNGNRGLFLYTLGYDGNLSSKLYSNTNVGFGWSAKNIGLADKNGGVNGSNFMGVEINNETGYKLYDNLTAATQLAYVVLGGAYTNTITKTDGGIGSPENPYTARIVLTYAF